MATHLHFGKAAEDSEIDQSALSRSIKLLKSGLGTALFERTSRRVSLTLAGAALLEDARQILLAADQAERRIRRLAHSDGHTLRVSFVAPASFQLLPRAIQHFDRCYGHVEVTLQELTSNNGPDLLRLGELDLCLIVRLKNDRDGLDELSTKILIRQVMIAAVPATWPMAGQDTISLAELANQPMVFSERPSSTASYGHSYGLPKCRLQAVGRS